MGILSLFGFGNGIIREALRKGAIIIDVRTAYEFDQGKVPGSINIPVDRILTNTVRIKDFRKPIVFCSASGTGSASAARLLKQTGLKEVYDGGSWQRVLKILNTL